MEVVFPLAGLNVSGGVKNLLLQAEALADAGHRVRVLAPDFAGSSAFPIGDRVQLQSLWSGPASRPRWARQLNYYARLARDAAAGVDVCVVAYYPTVYCAVISRLVRRSRARIVYSVAAYEPVTHGLAAESRLPLRWLRAGLAWFSYRLPTQRVYASHWLREQVGDARGVVIGRGIDTSVFSPAGRATSGPAEPLRIGVIGRSGPVKGYEDFMAAVAGLTNVQLRVLALDPVPLPSHAPALRLPSTNEAGMADFYRSCDIFVFTSLSEGFPAPPLEAMACGCAVITTDCGGVREYAAPGENCLVVPPGDPGALNAGLRMLCNDVQLRARLSQAGVRTAARFDRRQMLDQFLAVVA